VSYQRPEQASAGQLSISEILLLAISMSSGLFFSPRPSSVRLTSSWNDGVESIQRRALSVQSFSHRACAFALDRLCLVGIAWIGRTRWLGCRTGARAGVGRRTVKVLAAADLVV
jgi:hypothetical protein